MPEYEENPMNDLPAKPRNGLFALIHETSIHAEPSEHLLAHIDIHLLCMV